MKKVDIFYWFTIISLTQSAANNESLVAEVDSQSSENIKPMDDGRASKSSESLESDSDENFTYPATVEYSIITTNKHIPI